jgi:hypothetical protein
MTTPKAPRPLVLTWRSAVINDAKFSPADTLALLVLAEFADPDGSNCFPTIAALAQLSALADRTVRRTLTAAAARGYLDRQTSGRGGQGWKAYKYRLLLPEGADLRTARQRISKAEGADIGTAPLGERCGPTGPEVRTYATEGAVTRSDEVGEQLGQEVGGSSTSLEIEGVRSAINCLVPRSATSVSQQVRQRQPAPDAPPMRDVTPPGSTAR